MGARSERPVAKLPADPHACGRSSSPERTHGRPGARRGADHPGRLPAGFAPTSSTTASATSTMTKDRRSQRAPRALVCRTRSPRDVDAGDEQQERHRSEQQEPGASGCRARVGRRREQHRVDDAEDARGRPNSQHQRGERGQREGGRPPQHAQRGGRPAAGHRRSGGAASGEAGSSRSILSIAVGLAGATTLVGIADALLYQSPGVCHPRTVVHVGRTTNGSGYGTLSYPVFRHLRAGARTPEAMAATTLDPIPLALRIGSVSERAFGRTVSGSAGRAPRCRRRRARPAARRGSGDDRPASWPARRGATVRSGGIRWHDVADGGRSARRELPACAARQLAGPGLDPAVRVEATSRVVCGLQPSVPGPGRRRPVAGGSPVWRLKRSASSLHNRHLTWHFHPVSVESQDHDRSQSVPAARCRGR